MHLPPGHAVRRRRRSHPPTRSRATFVDCRSSTTMASCDAELDARCAGQLRRAPRRRCRARRGRPPLGPSVVSTTPGSKPSTPTPHRTSMPCDRMASATRPPKSASTTRSGCGRPLDHGRRATPLDVGLGHLQADVAAPDDDDPAAPGLGEGEQRLGVVERLHTVDERQVDAGQVRTDRLAAGGDEQFVVADAVDPAGVLVDELDLAGVGVDGQRLMVRAHVDATATVLVGGSGDERFDASGDESAHQERDAARRVAREAAPLEHDDLGLRAQVAHPGGSRHPGRITADDHRPERHERSSTRPGDGVSRMRRRGAGGASARWRWRGRRPTRSAAARRRHRRRGCRLARAVAARRRGRR